MSADLIEFLRAEKRNAHTTAGQYQHGSTLQEKWSDKAERFLEAANALAAKDAAISEMRAELERVKGALKPFAEAARKAGYYPHSHLLATREVTIQDFRRAASALASQDEGEER